MQARALCPSAVTVSVANRRWRVEGEVNSTVSSVKGEADSTASSIEGTASSVEEEVDEKTGD